MGLFNFLIKRNSNSSKLTRVEVVKDFPIIIRNGDEIVGAFNGGTENYHPKQMLKQMPKQMPNIELCRGIVFADTELCQSIIKHGYSFSLLSVIVKSKIINMFDGVVQIVEGFEIDTPQKFCGQDVIFISRIVIIFRR